MAAFINEVEEALALPLVIVLGHVFNAEFRHAADLFAQAVELLEINIAATIDIVGIERIGDGIVGHAHAVWKRFVELKDG